MRKAAGSLLLVALVTLSCEGRANPLIGIVTGDTTGVTPVSSATVRIINNAYQPNVVHLVSGGIVTWVWDSTATLHDVTFANASQSSPTQSGSRIPVTHTVVFSTPGTFDYHCTVHPEMAGSIVVH